jgi:hypothetical protein
VEYVNLLVSIEKRLLKKLGLKIKLYINNKSMKTIYKIKNKRNLQKLLICANIHISDLEYLKKEYNKKGDKFEYYKQTWEHDLFNLRPIFYIFPTGSYIILEGTKSSILKLERKINEEIIPLKTEVEDVFEAYLKYCSDKGISPQDNASFLK